MCFFRMLNVVKKKINAQGVLTVFCMTNTVMHWRTSLPTPSPALAKPPIHEPTTSKGWCNGGC